MNPNTEDQITITIPRDKLKYYLCGVLGVLHEVVITEKSNDQKIKNVKAVYQLLGHFELDEILLKK